MKDRFKEYTINCLIADMRNQKPRYKESYYLQYDDISNIRLKQRTNNVK